MNDNNILGNVNLNPENNNPSQQPNFNTDTLGNVNSSPENLTNATVNQNPNFNADTLGSVTDTPINPTVPPMSEANPLGNVNPNPAPPVVNQNVNQMPNSNVNQNQINNPPLNEQPIDNLFDEPANPGVVNSPLVNPVQSPTNPPVQNNNDDELLRAFIGKNYDKITSKPFNFAGFFLTTLYMFYRKMFLFGIALFLVNIIIASFIKIPIIPLLLNVLVGLFINKLYVYYAKQKIAKIKTTNPQKSLDELKAICGSKGGVSVGKAVLGFIAELGITIIIVVVMIIIGAGSIFGGLIDPSNWNISINNNNNNNEENKNNNRETTIAEDVNITGYTCFGDNCSLSVEEKKGKSYDYLLKDEDDSDFLKSLKEYSDYLKVDFYYTEKDGERTLENYKIYLKDDDEEIKDVKTEDELREKLGLYTVGTHTETLTLKEIGSTGFGYKDNASYSYTTYTFTNSDKIDYEMEYINTNGALNLTEGTKYTVTFEVTKGTFDYEYNIKSVK